MGKYNFFKDAKGGSGALDKEDEKGKFRKQFDGESADERAIRLNDEAQERSKKKKNKGKSKFSKIMNLFD
jgi:hypothetical protein